MKKPKKITEKELVKLEKEANKVKLLQEKVKQIYEQLRDINNNNNWIRYMSEEMQNNLTLEQKYKLQEICEIIIYADKFNE